MGFANQSTQQQMPYPAALVYEKLLEVIPAVDMSIQNSDETLMRISVSVGLSIFSWGENVSIVVSQVDENNSLVSIDSSLKMSVNVTGAYRHQKNFDKIIYALSDALKEWKKNQPVEYVSDKTDEEYLEEARRKAGLIP